MEEAFSPDDELVAEVPILEADAMDREMRRFEAEQALIDWAQVDMTRDDVIRRAATAGISIRRIQQLTGIARTTIYRILKLGSTDATT